LVVKNFFLFLKNLLTKLKKSWIIKPTLKNNNNREGIKVLLVGGPKDGEKMVIPEGNDGEAIRFCTFEPQNSIYNPNYIDPPDNNAGLPIYNYINYNPLIIASPQEAEANFQIYLFEGMSEEEGVQKLISNYKPKKSRKLKKLK
jgi:hypothetical protein